jgi:hypothetical protein
MPELKFSVEGAESVPFAAAPAISLKLHVTNSQPDEIIHTIALRAQIQIEATRRRYTDAEKTKLLDLFGEPDRWSRTLRSMLWTHSSVVIPSFKGGTIADLHIPCTFDFNVAATKYFRGITDGDIPLNLLFSGTIFYALPDGTLQVAPIPWNKEARFRLPVQVWRTMMDEYYPNCAWLAVHRDVFERLYEFKMRNGIPTVEETLERLLAAVKEAVVQ